MKKLNIHPTLAAFALSLSATGLTHAQEAVVEVTDDAEFAEAFETFDTLEPSVIIGSADEVFNLPGSGYYVDTNDIQENSYLSVNRVLAKVPGVYVREENGFGLFPNISIRGGDGTRSERVTIMEDGILQSPAPYSAASAYYSPNVSRMAGLEVLKGSSQVRYGPQTTSGAINYLSTLIPDVQTFYVRSIYGSDNTAQVHSYYGDVLEGDFGRIGFLGEMYWKRSDGFRTIDSGINYAGSDNTGFNQIEPMLKMFWEPNTMLDQRFEFKYGYTDIDADETYTGLSESDINRTPYRRYAGTYLDNIQTEQHRTYLKHIMAPTEDLTIETAGYYNQFTRNWYKIRQAGGESLHTLLANPSANQEAFDILRMRTEGELGIRANAREYYSYGIQTQVDYAWETGNIEHDFAIGARYNSDQIRRNQRDDDIVVRNSGNFVRRGEQGSGGNRRQESDAVALWAENTSHFGSLAITPGIRYEHINQSYTDFASDSRNAVTGGDSGTIDYVAPGVGFNYELNEEAALFGGIYKGFGVPSPRSVLNSGTDLEESIGYELGSRVRRGAFYGELVGFYTDFENLVGSDAGLGQGLQDQTNAGEAEVYGIEAIVEYDIAHSAGTGFSVPVYTSATWTTATLENSLSAGGGDDIYAGGAAGASIPYIPEWKLAMGIGVQTDRAGLDLSASYVSESFGTARNVFSPIDSSREGLIDGGFTVDLAAHYQVNDRVKLIGGVHNLLDEQLLTSRAPEGPRIAAPRQFYVGFEMLWEKAASYSGSTGGKSPLNFGK